MGAITAVSALGLAAGLALTGANLASAAPTSATPTTPTTSSSSITLPGGSVLANKITNYCGRVPKLIERADTAQTRIDGSATTKGSLLWLKAREAKATGNKHPRVAKRIDKVIARRTKRLSRLPEIKTRLTAANTECATLNLPAPSASDSSGS